MHLESRKRHDEMPPGLKKPLVVLHDGLGKIPCEDQRVVRLMRRVIEGCGGYHRDVVAWTIQALLQGAAINEVVKHVRTKTKVKHQRRGFRGSAKSDDLLSLLFEMAQQVG